MSESEIAHKGERRQLDVALVGAGVCGLACALALAKFGVPVQVFEAAVRVVQPRLMTSQIIHVHH